MPSTDVTDFSFLALFVSGGQHCLILKCHIGKYAIIGGTLVDSLGEAFDKLGLPVGEDGGPALEDWQKMVIPSCAVSYPVTET